jgi:hypothetical protein
MDKTNSSNVAEMNHEVTLKKIKDFITAGKTDIEIEEYMLYTAYREIIFPNSEMCSLIGCIRHLLKEAESKPIIGPLSEVPTREANPEFWRVVDSLSPLDVTEVRTMVFNHLDDVGSALIHNTDVSILVQYLLDNYVCWDELKMKLGVK